ncbi:MAG: YkvA family protein [Candidatus Cryptobacteroides sp.]
MNNNVNINEDDLLKYQEQYSEDKLWEKVKKFAKKIGGKTLYYVLVLYYVLQSKNVPAQNKALILGALGYFILPIDLIPDVIPAMGFVDDGAALALAYKAVKDSVTPEIEEKAKAKLGEWA